MTWARPGQGCTGIFIDTPTYNISTNPNQIKIEHKALRIEETSISNREVRYRLPIGTPPKNGWPVVIIFQGTYQPVMFNRFKNDRYGLYFEVQLIELLLQNGYAVIAPDARNRFAWETNFPKYANNFDKTLDYRFMINLFIAIEESKFGPLDAQQLFATGLSSGGYMTGRMGISFGDRFRAIAIQSASYATCMGAECVVPNRLPRNHPPTLLLHGKLDQTVPEETAKAYYKVLKNNNIPTEFYSNSLATHQWIPESPVMIPKFFNHMRR